VVIAVRVHEDRTMRTAAPVVAVLAILAIAGALVAAAIAGADQIALAPFLFTAVAGPAGVGVLVAWRRPGERVAWILLVGALSVGVVMCADQVSAHLLERDRTSTAGRWIRVLAGEWPVLFLWPLALAYLFPDGRLPGPRWRIPWRITLVAATGVLGLLPFARHLSDPFDDVLSPMPVTFEGSFGLTVFWICWAGLLGGLFAGAAAVWWRKRRATGERRLQMLWLSYGAFLVPLWLSSGWIMGLFGSDSDDVGFVWLLLLYVWLAVAVGVAVTRHGLYGIERLINRTLVYGALTIALGASYGIVVLVAGVVFGGSSAVRASLATLVVALAFGPLRRRLQVFVDWRFSRARYEGTRRLRAFLDEVRGGHAEPEDVATEIASALRDPSAEVVYLLPASGAWADRRGHTLDAVPEDGRAHTPIGRDDRQVGVLLHDPQLLARADLLHAVLDAAAVAVEIACLRVEVRLQLEEVESSRARIVQAGVEERRRLERDLHDGAQQRLVTLGIVLRRLQRSLPPEARTLVPALDAAVDEVVAAITDLRTIAAGLRPPRLDQGLRAALADLARGAGVPVALDAAAHRAPPEVEAAAYYVACEALTNAVKHASATKVQLRTDQRDGVLHLLVADDGVGGAAANGGTGLAGLADRVAAQGGRLVIESPPGAGTRIAAEFPCA
jgi:signal transduction histidine kinase